MVKEIIFKTSCSQCHHTISSVCDNVLNSSHLICHLGTYQLISMLLITAKKYNNAKRSIPAHSTFVNDVHRFLHLWP